MHDLDRAMFETGEAGQEVQEAEQSEQQEFMDLLTGLTRGRERGRRSTPASERFGETTSETASAAELLEVQETAELDRFLGNLIRRAAGAATDFVRSDAGRALRDILKQAATAALPMADKENAEMERAGRNAGAVFGLELEGLSHEDRELEVAKAFVRFANAATRHATQAPAGAQPGAVAAAATTTAARRHAPGLLAALRARGPSSGRWERQGDQIVLFDA